MTRKTFSAKDKKAAVQAMIIGNRTQKQIAEKFGCSLAALQLWKKDPAHNPQVAEEEEWEEEENEEYESESSSKTEVKEEVSPPSVHENTRSHFKHESERTSEADQEAVHCLKKRYWSEDSRGVDMLLTPTSASPDDVVKLINEALEYAYKHLKK